MNYNIFLWLCLFILNFHVLVLAQSDSPPTISIDPGLLYKSKELIVSNNKDLMPSYKALIRQANKYLNEGPFSVMNKEKSPPSGDKHDYLSLSIYSWPNPKTKDSLPYITRDGEVNPQSKIGTDEESFVKVCEYSFSLALAYYFSGSEKYAEHSADLIRTWFIDPKTKMNPNLNCTQVVMGKNDGSSGGIIDSRNLIYVTEAAELLRGSTSWRSEDMQDLKSWFKDYLGWLLTSKNGMEEGKTKNNHLTFYKAQVVDYALFTGNKDEALKQLESVKDLVENQIEPDGRQPLEMNRTKSFNYSVFNLQAFFLLGELGRNAGVDLYNFITDDGKSIRKALDYVAPYSDSLLDWKGKEIGSRASGIYWLGELLRIASLRFPDGKYGIILNDNYGNAVLSKQWQLLYPS
jgi:hypothetical protein